MRRLLFLFLYFLAFRSEAQVNRREVYVQPYTRSNGTRVEGHYRTAPNSTNRDNFSTRPNTNPHTGRPGYIEPDNHPFKSRPSQDDPFSPPSNPGSHRAPDSSVSIEKPNEPHLKFGLSAIVTDALDRHIPTYSTKCNDNLGQERCASAHCYYYSRTFCRFIRPSFPEIVTR